MGKNHRYNIRLDPHNPEHMEVERLFQDAARGGIRELIVNAVLAYSAESKTRMDKDGVQEIVQSTVRATLDALGIRSNHIAGAGLRQTAEQGNRPRENEREPVDPGVADLMDSSLRGFGL